MSAETHGQRVIWVGRWSHDREKCRHCGYLRIHVLHEPDPENAPEGFAYYQAFRDELHEFIPSGEFAK